MNIGKKLITNDTLTFIWADESEPTTYRFEDFTKDMQTRAMQHGLSQKLGDAYSGATSIAEAKIRQEEVFKALMENDWNRKGGSSGGLIIEALAQAANVSFEDALEAWNGYDDDKRKMIRADKTVKVEVAKLELARKLEAAKGSEGFTL